MNASGTSSKEEHRWNPWEPASANPRTTLDKSKMAVAALVSSIKYTMKNHVYTFNSKYYKKVEGGAISVGLASEVASGFMIWWDHRLKSLLSNSQIELQL